MKHRRQVNKAKSVKQFARNVERTKRPNVIAPPQRGGWRL